MSLELIGTSASWLRETNILHNTFVLEKKKFTKAWEV